MHILRGLSNWVTCSMSVSHSELVLPCKHGLHLVCIALHGVLQGLSCMQAQVVLRWFAYATPARVCASQLWLTVALPCRHLRGFCEGD